jgi:hypothetical protein
VKSSFHDTGSNQESPRRRGNPTTHGRFTKGDARINHRGRPKSFDNFRKICQKVLGESVKLDGKTITRAEKLARDWCVSKEPILQRAVAEYAFGKVPDKLEATGLEDKTILILHYAHEREEPTNNSLPDAAPTLSLTDTSDHETRDSGN